MEMLVRSNADLPRVGAVLPLEVASPSSLGGVLRDGHIECGVRIQMTVGLDWQGQQWQPGGSGRWWPLPHLAISSRLAERDRSRLCDGVYM